MSVSLSKKLTLHQCEGCYEPLGPMLDDGTATLSTFNIVWYHCLAHQPVSNVPFDVYDDYDDGYNGGCSGVF